MAEVCARATETISSDGESATTCSQRLRNSVGKGGRKRRDEEITRGQEDSKCNRGEMMERTRKGAQN
jgi:hypothetical protein